MPTYPEDRARRIETGPTGKASYNGRFSRQQRRANAREADKEPMLSHYLTRRLEVLRPGEGLFMTRSAGHRQLVPGAITERMKSSADYTNRYKALFTVLPGA